MTEQTLTDRAFAPLLAPALDRVLHIETRAYDHPWTRTHFLDALASGYEAKTLQCDGTILGYFVAMQGVGEAHLLNITVAPEHQGQGHARALMAELRRWAGQVAAQRIWLEVRVGNARAIRLYESLGYQRVNVRKNYYPALGTAREDALVMFFSLDESEPA